MLGETCLNNVVVMLPVTIYIFKIVHLWYKRNFWYVRAVLGVWWHDQRIQFVNLHDMHPTVFILLTIWYDAKTSDRMTKGCELVHHSSTCVVVLLLLMIEPISNVCHSPSGLMATDAVARLFFWLGHLDHSLEEQTESKYSVGVFSASRSFLMCRRRELERTFKWKAKPNGHSASPVS